MKLRFVRSAACAVGVFALVFGATFPAHAAPTDSDESESSVASSGESTPAPGLPISIGAQKDDALVVGVTGEDQVTPYLFDPIDSLQCDVLGNADHTITNYSIYRFDTPSGDPWITAGAVSLLCGTDTTSGFKHIRSRHQSSTSFHPNSWETIRSSAIAAGANPGIPWDDYMDHAIQDSLDFAMPFPANIGGGKACFSTIFHIWVGEEVYASWYVNSIVAVSNRLVVTAYPSDIAYTSDCNP